MLRNVRRWCVRNFWCQLKDKLKLHANLQIKLQKGLKVQHYAILTIFIKYHNSYFTFFGPVKSKSSIILWSLSTVFSLPPPALLSLWPPQTRQTHYCQVTRSGNRQSEDVSFSTKLYWRGAGLTPHGDRSKSCIDPCLQFGGLILVKWGQSGFEKSI